MVCGACVLVRLNVCMHVGTMLGIICMGLGGGWYSPSYVWGNSYGGNKRHDQAKSPEWSPVCSPAMWKSRRLLAEDLSGYLFLFGVAGKTDEHIVVVPKCSRSELTKDDRRALVNHFPRSEVAKGDRRALEDHGGQKQDASNRRTNC